MVTQQDIKQVRSKDISGKGRSVLFQFLLSPKGFLVPVLLTAILLAVGSYHPSPPSAAGRITYLENVIKCPVCDDISIAQSDASIATQLRASVVKWVKEGRSNTWIENVVVDRFGTNELLVPRNNLVFIIPAVAIGVAAVLLLLYYRKRSKSYKDKLSGANG